MKVLVVFADPTRQLDQIAEARAIEDVYDKAQHRAFEHDFLFAASIDDLQQKLLRGKYNVVHFSGHASPLGLLFESGRGEGSTPNMAALGALLRSYSPPLECVLLNACDSIQQAELARYGVPFVIATEQPQYDKPAIAFTSGFYSNLAVTQDYLEAFEYAKNTTSLKHPGQPLPVLRTGKPRILILHASQDFNEVDSLGKPLVDLGYGYRRERLDIERAEADSQILREGLKYFAAVAVCVGARGELISSNTPAASILIKAQELRLPVIPIAVSGGSAQPRLPNFLRTTMAIKLDPTAPASTAARILAVISGEHQAHPDPGSSSSPPVPPPSFSSPDPETLNETVITVTDNMKVQSAVYFVGKGLFDNEQEEHYQNASFAGHLIEKLRINPVIVPPEFAATCYAIKNKYPGLDTAIAEHLRQPRQAGVKAALLFARVLALVEAQRAREPDIGEIRRQLVVATHLDDLLERAMVTAGVSFSRVVQYRPDSDGNCKLAVATISSQEGSHGALTVKSSSTAIELDEARRNALEFKIPGMAEPQAVIPIEKFRIDTLHPVILYKPFGSFDCRGSCTVSIDQGLQFAGAAVNHPKTFPATLTTLMSASPALFLGCNPLDADSLLLYFGLLRRIFETGASQNDRYMIGNPPTPYFQNKDSVRHCEARLWQSIPAYLHLTLGITCLFANPLEFLQALTARLSK